MIKLTWEEWVDQFKPIRNPAKKLPKKPDKYNQEQYEFDTLDGIGLAIAINGKMYVTWTEITEGVEGCIVSGKKRVNRMMYYVTKIPYIITEQYEIAPYKWR